MNHREMRYMTPSTKGPVVTVAFEAANVPDIDLALELFKKKFKREELNHQILYRAGHAVRSHKDKFERKIAKALAESRMPEEFQVYNLTGVYYNDTCDDVIAAPYNTLTLVYEREKEIIHITFKDGSNRGYIRPDVPQEIMSLGNKTYNKERIEKRAKRKGFWRIR